VGYPYVRLAGRLRSTPSHPSPLIIKRALSSAGSHRRAYPRENVGFLGRRGNTREEKTDIDDPELFRAGTMAETMSRGSPSR